MNDITTVERKCLKCGETKPTTEFWKSGRKRGDGYETRCKGCRKAQRYERIAADPERHRQKVNANQRRFYVNNPSAVKAASKRYQLKNPEKIKAVNKTYRANYFKTHGHYPPSNRDPVKLAAFRIKYRSRQNELSRAPDKRAKIAARRRKQRANNLHFRLLGSLRTRVYNALKGLRKSQRTVILLGCSVENFRIYIESKFEVGMSWDNYGKGDNKWNIEHEIPCDLFDLAKEAHQKICFHFSNMRPMWQPENLKKSNKATPEIVEKFHKRLSEQSV